MLDLKREGVFVSDIRVASYVGVAHRDVFDGRIWPRQKSSSLALGASQHLSLAPCIVYDTNTVSFRAYVPRTDLELSSTYTQMYLALMKLNNCCFVIVRNHISSVLHPSCYIHRRKSYPDIQGQSRTQGTPLSGSSAQPPRKRRAFLYRAKNPPRWRHSVSKLFCSSSLSPYSISVRCTSH